MALPPLLPRSEPAGAATPPPPTTATHTTPPTADGTRLHLSAWTRPSTGDGIPPPGTPPTVVVIHHGLGEYGGRYERVAAALLARVPAVVGVYAHDARGHGRSPGRRGLLKGSAAAADDWLSTVLPAVGGLLPRAEAGVRVVLLGHSMGGLVLAAVAAGDAAAPAAALSAGRAAAAAAAGEPAGGPVVVTGLIFSSAALRIRAPGLLRAVLPLAKVVAAVGLAAVPTPTGITPEQLTHDAAEAARIRADPLMHTTTCVGMGADMVSAGQRHTATMAEAARGEGAGGCLATAPGVRVLVLACPDDPLCDATGSAALVAALGGDSRGTRVTAVTNDAGGLHEWLWEDAAHAGAAWHDAVAAFVAGAGGGGTGGVPAPALASPGGA